MTKSALARILIAVTTLFAGLALVATGDSAAVPVAFLETFDGSPSTVAPWRPSNWGVDANNSDMWADDGLHMDTMAAHHGGDCGAPPATHSISTLDQAVFQCRDHVMTSVAGGYAAAYLTPPAMVDLRSGEAVVRFDVSTLRGSGRDWIDLWVTPFGDQLALPLNVWLPPYNGEPQRGIQLKMEGESRFEGYQYTPTRRGTNAKLPIADWTPYERWLTPSATTRSTFELRLSRTHVSFCMPAYGRCWVNTNLAVPLDWDQGVVQLAHHSYNAVKDCGGSGCVNSWHWDNVNVEPATVLDIVPAAPRWAVATADQTSITLQRPAPTGASLRFAAVGTIQVSFDGGRTYTPAVRRSLDRRAPEHFSSYLQPIPAGTTTITFRGGADQYIWRWMVAHVNVLAPGSTPTTTTTAAPTTTAPPTTVAPTTTSTTAAPTTTTLPPTTLPPPTTTTTVAPTTTTTAPPPPPDPARDCPAVWVTSSGCRVPVSIHHHLVAELGQAAADAAVASLERWYAGG